MNELNYENNFVSENFLGEFLERINEPLGIEPIEFLKTFSIGASGCSMNSEGSEMATETEGSQSTAPIYPIVKYLHI